MIIIKIKSTWTKVNNYKCFPRWLHNIPPTSKWKMPSNEDRYSSGHFHLVAFVSYTILYKTLSISWLVLKDVSMITSKWVLNSWWKYRATQKSSSNTWLFCQTKTAKRLTHNNLPLTKMLYVFAPKLNEMYPFCQPFDRSLFGFF